MNARERAAAYVLDELDERQRADVERRLDTDAELKAEIEALRSLTASLGELPEEAWPQEAVERERAATTAHRPARVWRLRPTVALAGVLLALVAGGLLGAVLGDDDGSPGPPTAAAELQLRPLSPASSARGRVAMPRPNEMVLTVNDLPRSNAGQYYELWLMSDAQRTVPVASFRVDSDGGATVRVPLPADPARYRYFDISRQAAAAGTGHSSDSVLRGPTSAS